MKNNIKKYFLFLIVVALQVGCTKDFLDVPPIGVINSNSFYSTKADAESAVTAVYGMINYMTVWDQWLLSDLGSVASDDAEAGGNNAEDTPAYQDVDKFTFTPSINSGAFAPQYGIMYKTIFMANMALERLPDIPALDSTASVGFINKRLAEVKFLRALSYFYLVQVYGEVPLVDHVLGASEYAASRSSLRSIFDLMEQDLTDAIGVLPLSYDANNIGRVTKGAAQALLAKVYLLESSYAHYYPNDKYSLVNPGQSRFKDLKERWSDAQTMAENVMNSGQYKLVGIDGERYSTWRGDNTDGFRYIWSTEGNNSKESVFEIQCEYLGLGWLKTRGSSLVWWTGARWIYDPTTGNPAESKYWGFNVPSYSLKAEFNKEKRESGDPFYGTLTPADPRFNTTIHMDTVGGNDSINQTGTDIWAKICYQYTPTQYNPTGMYQAKYECSYDEYLGLGGSWSEAPFNTRLIRYSDVVLVAAEAAIMNADNTNALKYINMVRTRARMCGPKGNTVPADYAVGTTVTMDMLKHERRLELALEGQRFFDLVRWNDAVSKLNGQVLAATGFNVSFISPKNDFYPIPQDEINTSEGNLTQYEGW